MSVCNGLTFFFRMYGLFQTSFYFGYMALFSLALGIMCGKTFSYSALFVSVCVCMGVCVCVCVHSCVHRCVWRRRRDGRRLGMGV